MHRFQGKLSVSTTRLLKAVLPAACLWTGLREVEGFGYEETVQELRKLYPSDEADDEMGEDSNGLSSNVPEAIRSMADSKNAVESLGAMVWYDFRHLLGGYELILVHRYLRQLNIDKDILSMKNFNIYDPMKRGLGMVLDGQSLAHLEVSTTSLEYIFDSYMGFTGAFKQRWNRGWYAVEAAQ
jgi:DNA mismatch repair protein MSH6